MGVTCLEVVMATLLPNSTRITYINITKNKNIPSFLVQACPNVTCIDFTPLKEKVEVEVEGEVLQTIQ